MTSIDASYNINEKDLKAQQNINEKDLKAQQNINEKDLKAQQNINEKDLKPKRTLLQKIIKLHKFLCFQATTLLVATIILSSLCKCYDILIYISFGIFISILFMGCYGLLLKFEVLASREFNEKYNNSIFNLWKNYVPCDETSFFPFMAVFTILWHMFFGFLALYYVKNFIKNSIITKYSYIVGYLLILLFFAINYNSAFKLYNNSLKCSVNEFNNGAFFSLFIVAGIIYYFETIKSNYLNTNCLLYLL